jgi:hypothetical protein
MTAAKRWHVEILIDEHEDERRTRAEARLHTEDKTHLRGVGTAYRNPADVEICSSALRIPAATPNDGVGSDRREDVMGIGWQILWVMVTSGGSSDCCVPSSARRSGPGRSVAMAKSARITSPSRR